MEPEFEENRAEIGWMTSTNGAKWACIRQASWHNQEPNGDTLWGALSTSTGIVPTDRRKKSTRSLDATNIGQSYSDLHCCGDCMIVVRFCDSLFIDLRHKTTICVFRIISGVWADSRSVGDLRISSAEHNIGILHAV